MGNFSIKPNLKSPKDKFMFGRLYVVCGVVFLCRFIIVGYTRSIYQISQALWKFSLLDRRLSEFAFLVRLLF